MQDNFASYKEAAKQVRLWKAQYPSAKFRIQQYASGNKVRWQIIQINRFAE